MHPTSDLMNNYHDKKRTIEYYRIARLIDEENKCNPSKPPKAIIGSKPDTKDKDKTNLKKDPIKN